MPGLALAQKKGTPASAKGTPASAKKTPAPAKGTPAPAKGTPAPATGAPAPAAGAPATGAPAVVEVPRRAETGSGKVVKRLAPPLGCDRVTLAEGLPNSNVRAVVQDQQGFMWLGTANGLARYDGNKMRLYRAGADEATTISSGYITALALDATGKLWIGTPESGINLYDPQTDRFTRFLMGRGGLSSEGVTAIARDKKDRMWFAMSGGGLNRYDAATGTFSVYVTEPLDAAITAIHPDKDGTLWLGTGSEGVIRWNPDTGSTTTYRPTPGDDAGLGGAGVTSILVSSTGQIWIGSDGAGLLSLDPATHTFIRQKDLPGAVSVGDGHVSVIVEDADKRLWIGTSSGLNQMDSTGRIIQYQYDPDDPTSIPFPGVESIAQDRGGVMWIGGFTNGLCKFDKQRLLFGHYRTRAHVSSFHEDADGTLWVGTYNDGLYKYDRAEQRVTGYRSLGTPGEDGSVALDSAWITALHRDRRGTLWISMKGQGLVAFNTKTEKHRQYVPDPEVPNGLPVDTIFDLWEDDAGMLWLATWGGGLVRLDPQLDVFTAFTAEADADDSHGLTSNHLYNLYPDPSDKKILWLGTAKGGLVRFDITTTTGTSFRHNEDDPTSLSSDDVLTVHREPSGALWVGTLGGGVNRLDPATGKVERFTTSNSTLANDAIYGILPDDDGKLWLSTDGGGLVHLDPKARTFFAYDGSDGVQSSEFSQGSFMRSKSGELFFGGARGFNAFVPRNITRDTYVPPVVMTTFTLKNKEVALEQPIWTLPGLKVSYSDSFEVQFAALAFVAPKENRYAYKLEGFDDEFIATDRPYASYAKLPGGKYTLRIRAANRHGVWNETGIALKLAVTPPIWRTWMAYIFYLLVAAGLAYLVVRMQRQRVRRAEREGRLAVVERDLELTGAVQTGFLPEHNEINTEHLQMLGLYKPADACGGDWWWHEPLSAGRHVVLCGDVTGHGPGPAMVTAAVATAFRVLMENGLDDVTRALELLNKEVLRVGKGRYHMTMAALEVEEATGRWILYSAGAPPMLSLNRNGKHKVHFCAGAPLGTETGFETGRVEGKLEPTERLLMYTDGIPEIILPNGNAMGMRRFSQEYERTRPQGLRDAAASIFNYADLTQAGQAQGDDWTLTMIEWGNTRGGQNPNRLA